jgi:hypothetical protein
MKPTYLMVGLAFLLLVVLGWNQPTKNNLEWSLSWNVPIGSSRETVEYWLKSHQIDTWDAAPSKISATMYQGDGADFTIYFWFDSNGKLKKSDVVQRLHNPIRS